MPLARLESILDWLRDSDQSCSKTLKAVFQQLHQLVMDQPNKSVVRNDGSMEIER
jgi:hypothetical protein